MKYKIVRFFLNGSRKRTIETGVSLEEAQKHTTNPESSYKTCKKPEGRRRTREHGPWFDGFQRIKE